MLSPIYPKSCWRTSSDFTQTHADQVLRDNPNNNTFVWLFCNGKEKLMK